MDIIELVLLAFAQILQVFGSRPSGKYQDAAQTTTIEFKKRKVFVKFTQGQPPLSVKVRTDRVIVKFQDGDRLFTYNSKDNSFTGPNGLLLAHVPEKAQKTADVRPASLNESKN